MTWDEAKTTVAVARQIADLWVKVSRVLKRSKGRILITGMEGVGKTVLFDYMTGKAYQPGYRPSGSSGRYESGRLKHGKGSLGMVVIPGQNSHPRLVAAESTIIGKDPPVGVIHVVANGFSIQRDAEKTEAKTLDTYRRLQRIRETDELAEVCHWIRQAHRKHRRPNWLLLVANKYDLYENEPFVRNQYALGGHGPVARMLETLTGQVGSDNFRWQSATACGWLSDFEWKSHRSATGLMPAARDTMIQELVKDVLALCGHDGEL